DGNRVAAALSRQAKLIIAPQDQNVRQRLLPFLRRFVQSNGGIEHGQYSAADANDAHDGEGRSRQPRKRFSFGGGVNLVGENGKQPIRDRERKQIVQLRRV